AAELQKKLAERYLEASRVDDAERVLAGVFEAAPDDPVALRLMARVHGSRHEEGREIETLQRLAGMMIERRQFATCLEVVDDILKLDPDTLRAVELRVDALQSNNRVAEAVAACFDLADRLTGRGEAGRGEP